MKDNQPLILTEIQRFCMHDGPGVRTTVFLKGCPLRCAWCHNPETQRRESELLFYAGKCMGCGLCATVCPQGVHTLEGQHYLDRGVCKACGECVAQCPTCALDVCGKPYTIAEILAVVERDVAFYGELGGVTLSGGEPLLQGQVVVDLLQACRERGISTVVETCGFVDKDILLSAIPYTDLFLWDVKDTDPLRHKQYTGVSNRLILDNLRRADAMGAVTRLRCILVSGVNTCETHFRAVAKLASTLAHCEGVELIPYHAYAGTKATFLGGADNGQVAWIPTEAQINTAREVIEACGVRVF